MLRKPVHSTPSCADGGYCVEIQVDYPTLADFLCQAFWEDETGKRTRRTPGTVVLFVEDGRLKACVNDKDLNRVAFYTFDGPDTFWKQLEGVMAADKLDWRKGGGKK
jgi:hypothetical protein